jgi:ATP-dependent exoDNAse (exonuclease V) alpha subunit
MTQDKAIELALAGHNIFLTGKAGTGKTYTLNKIIEEMRKRGKIVAKTASTGIASTLIDGTTIHSWAGIGIKNKLTEEDLHKLRNNRFTRDRFDSADVLVIDEISMLHDYRLDMIEDVCSFVRGRIKGPFGGLQVIVSGDFFQLPPVNTGNASSEKNYCCQSQAWHYANFKTCYLHKIYRQNSDDKLVDVLNAIRRDDINDSHLAILDQAVKNTKNLDKSINLFCKNVNVDILNSQELVKLPTESFLSKSEVSGLEWKAEQIKKNMMAPDNLILKKGAKVMVVINDFKKRIVNGTLAEVTDLSGIDSGYVEIKILKTGDIVKIKKHKWEIEEYNRVTLEDEIVASVKQYPLRLAWALTVHKSQGASFDYASIDLADAFVENQGYVALSRLTSFEGLHLSGYNKSSLKVDPDVILKDMEFIEESKKNEEL